MVDSHLSSGQQIRFWVTSNSMSPLFRAGDTLLVEKMTAAKVKLGEVVLIQRDHDYLTHRIIGKSGNKWLTKGDNNVMPDTACLEDALTGRVIGIDRLDKIIDLQTHKWKKINQAMAKFSLLEWKAFQIHRYLRLPFRAAIKTLQNLTHDR